MPQFADTTGDYSRGNVLGDLVCYLVEIASDCRLTVDHVAGFDLPTVKDGVEVINRPRTESPSESLML